MHTKITYQFTPASDCALFSDMPGAAFKIHTYGLKRQQIPGWKLRTSDICKTLHLSIYAVKTALKWLQKNGYASYTRAYGFTRWIFRATPTAPGIPEQVEIRPVEQVVIQPVLKRDRYIEKEKTTTPETEKMPPNFGTPPEPDVVVVNDSELIYPAQLTPEQKKDAKRIIKKVKKPELTQEILFELAYIITSGNIKKSVPACLHGLVKAANENGHFTSTQAQGATQPGGKPRSSPIYQSKGQPAPCNQEKAKGYIQQVKSALRGAL